MAANIAQSIIQKLLQELGDNWRTVEDLLKMPASDAKIRVLQMHFPNQEIMSMNRDMIAREFEALYWSPIGASEIHSSLAIEGILRAVLYVGLNEAIRIVQKMLDLSADGIIGPQTLRAINAVDENEFSMRCNSAFIDYLSHKNQESNAESSSIRSEINIKKSNDRFDTKSEVKSESFEAIDRASQVEKKQTKNRKMGDDFGKSFAEHVNDSSERYPDEQVAQEPESALTKKAARKKTTKKRAEKKAPGNATPSSPIPKFNIDAVAKKSTSDLWTIKDQLGYEIYAQSIATLIIQEKAEPPLTISIQAPWGQGKTSLMRMIENKLNKGLFDDQDDTAQATADSKAVAATAAAQVGDQQPGKNNPNEINNGEVEVQENETPGTAARLDHLIKWINRENKIEPSPIRKSLLANFFDWLKNSGRQLLQRAGFIKKPTPDSGAANNAASGPMLQTKPGTMHCVWFNPLYFENSKQIWAGLAHSILYQLSDKLETQLQRECFWFRLRLTRINASAIRRDAHKLILERVFPKVIYGIALLLTTLLLGFSKLFEGTVLGGMLSSNVWFSFIPVYGAVARSLYSFLNKNRDWSLDDRLTKYIDEPNYENDLGMLHLVEHDLDRALELLLGEDPRLVIFIDDLDRCSPKTVNEILLAINQFISVQNRKLYFILGMDTHMVAMAVETAAEKQAETYNKNHKSSKSYGWRFIEKFVQLPVFLPRITQSHAKQFLGDLLTVNKMEIVDQQELEKLKVDLQDAYDPNQIQNLINAFKVEHNLEFLPQVDGIVATKKIEMTTREDSETLQKLIAAAISDLELNPRHMKRFLNVARLLFSCTGQSEDITSDEYMLKIVRASHLALNWPQNVRWLQGNAQNYTIAGDKVDPVEHIEKLLTSKEGNSFVGWSKQLQAQWGDIVANMAAQPDFYAYVKRIHQDRPNLSDIFAARIF